MSKKVLITYASKSGSTGEVAVTIGKTLSDSGVQVEIRPIKDVQQVSAYDAVIVGAPMILGWHREAVKFIQQAELKGKLLACFVTCLELTPSGEDTIDGVSISVDPVFPTKTGKLNFKEKQTSTKTYLQPIVKKAASKPRQVGFFKGKLDYSQLDLLSRLFVRLVIRGKAGDFRNWDAIRAWATDVSQKLN